MGLLFKLSSKKAAVLTTTLIIASLVACAPNDEKVRGAFGNTDNSDARTTDQVEEFSRSMLIELADVARQTEAVLQMVNPPDQAPAVTPAEPMPETPATPIVPAALRTVACKVVQVLPSLADTVKFQTDIKGCKEKGPTFEAMQFGRENAFASVMKKAGEPDTATVIRVEGKGLETILNPIKNPKDALRVKSSRFLEAEFVKDESGARTYRFTFESHSSYNLDLKSSVDNGQIVSKIQGTFEFDMTSKKISRFRAAEPTDRLELKVISARQSKSGGRITRQEFSGTGMAPSLEMNLSACALPIGSMKSRYTVAALGTGKKFDVDSTIEIESSKDSFVDKAKVGKPKSVTNAKLCTADEQITMTEYYSGLIY